MQHYTHASRQEARRIIISTLKEMHELRGLIWTCSSCRGIFGLHPEGIFCDSCLGENDEYEFYEYERELEAEARQRDQEYEDRMDEAEYREWERERYDEDWYYFSDRY